PKYVLGSLDQSLKRMRLDYVEIFYSHRFDPDTPLEETMGALHAAVGQGKTRYVGISSYGPRRTEEAARILRELGTPLLIHQPSYSMFNRWIEEELLDVLDRAGVGGGVFSLPARRGPVDGQVHRGGSGGLARAARQLLRRGDDQRREPRPRPRVGRDRGS